MAEAHQDEGIQPRQIKDVETFVQAIPPSYRLPLILVSIAILGSIGYRLSGGVWCRCIVSSER